MLLQEPAGTRAGAPERIARVITRDILRGIYPPGARLPTLRELAIVFEVNPSTMQRALVRLEAIGLVTARQGSGLRVNDPLVSGDMSVLPDWFAVLVAEEPHRAVTMLTEVLEMRRMLASRLVQRNRPAILEVMTAMTVLPEDMIGRSSAEVCAIELDMERRVVGATGSVAAVLLHRAIEECVLETPQLIEAAFGDAERVAAHSLAFGVAVAEGGDDLAVRLERIVAANDAVIIDNFLVALGLG